MTWAERRRRLQGLWWGRVLLWTLSMGYGAAVLARRTAYALGVLKTRRPGAKVVCIGNLTTGGTGKTPAVLLAAQTLRRRNHPVAILTRGYGRTTPPDELCVLTEDTHVPWTECGDEPWMMQQALSGSGVPILVCADRAKSSEQAVRFFHSKILVLDDGFQHHRLARDLDIVLLNATDPFGGGSLLPLGDLREPMSALSRAQVVVLTRVDQVSESALEALRQRVKELSPEAALCEAVHKPDFLLELGAGRRHRLSHLEGKEACALSGIGDPASFEAQLEGAGVRLTQRWRYRDHHRFTMAELETAQRLRGGRPVVTTFKDLARFPAGWEAALPGETYALAVKLELLKGRNVWTDRLVALAGEKGS